MNSESVCIIKHAMTTRIEGVVRNYETGQLYQVNEVLEAGTDHQIGSYLVNNIPLVPFSIIDTENGAVIDIFGAHYIDTQEMDLKKVKGEYGEVFPQNGIIFIDGTIELWRHEGMLSLRKFDPNREHLRISYALPREIIHSNIA